MKRKLFIIWLFSCINYSMNLYAFPGNEKDVDFTVHKGVIYSKSGIPQTPRWFADSRLAFSFEEKGITQVDYYYPDCCILCRFHNFFTQFMGRIQLLPGKG